MTNPSAPITERRYVLPLILVTSLFFLWAFGVNLNDILIPHLKKAFRLTDFRSSLIQTAFFGGYFLAALPAGWLMEKIGYKRGILVGLLACATGALLFIPAASVKLYLFFLFALFIMACGQGVLEVAANPYVTILGPPESSERRLNLAQSFNAVGAVVTPVVGAAFILSGVEHSRTQLSAMTPPQLAAYQADEAATVKVPYLVIAGLFLAVAALIFFSPLPEVREADGDRKTPDQAAGLRGLLPYKHLLKGVLAQFFYVGAQLGVASFVIRFAQFSMPGLPEKHAANYLKLHLLGFMIGRFAGSGIRNTLLAPPAAFSVCPVGINLSHDRAAWNRSGADVGAGPARVLSFHHVPDHFRPEPQASRLAYQTGLFVAGDVYYWRRCFSCHHGLPLLYDQYSLRFSGSILLSSLCTLFCGTRVPTGG